MKNTLVIATETFKQKMGSKAAYIMLLLLMVLTFVGMNYEKIFSSNDEKRETVVVVTEDKSLLATLRQAENEGNILFKDGGKTVAEAEKSLSTHNSKTIVKLSADQQGLYMGTIYYKGAIMYGLTDELQRLISALNQSMKLSQLQLTEEQQNFLLSNHTLSLKALDQSQTSSQESMMLIYVVGFVLYIAVMLFSNMVAQDIAVEKNSRVMEVLLTMITPVQHLIGKIVGIGVFGLTYAVSIMLAAFGSYKLFGDSSGLFSFLMDKKNLEILLLSIVCFISGYLVYSVMAAILGSLVSTVQEVQQLLYVLVIPLFAAMIMTVLMVTGMGSNQAILVSSYLPFISPVLMLARYALGDASLQAFFIAMGINLTTTIILSFFGKKVYQGGVFIYSGDKITNVLKRAFTSGKYYA
ncbi:ABC transporter permease [Carnobacterium divergens]|uniref:ABC transporter permease n=1 Tax=Carnobacterium divergens TaxID=2748 RepID=UPI001072D357|nr:ABC transporter permease [Carnobacterium divergens]TFJ44231.1 ABC transporter permease [Carnobacterium divergens]TFJ50873.1 ABC transporter permease [Carnobacterium divergens]